MNVQKFMFNLFKQVQFSFTYCCMRGPKTRKSIKSYFLNLMLKYFYFGFGRIESNNFLVLGINSSDHVFITWKIEARRLCHFIAKEKHGLPRSETPSDLPCGTLYAHHVM